MLPDVQSLGTLAKALKVRSAPRSPWAASTRLYTPPRRCLLARHLGEHPTFIANVRGISVAYLAIEPLEAMLEKPGCPNLYWALTSLPTPLVSLEKGREGERLWIAAELRVLDDTAPMSAEQIQGFIAHADRLLACRAESAGSAGVARHSVERRRDRGAAHDSGWKRAVSPRSGCGDFRPRR